MGKFNKWDLNYKGERGDRTGPNILFKALPELSFYDKQKDILCSTATFQKTMLAEEIEHCGFRNLRMQLARSQ